MKANIRLLCLKLLVCFDKFEILQYSTYILNLIWVESTKLLEMESAQEFHLNVLI